MIDEYEQFEELERTLFDSMDLQEFVSFLPDYRKIEIIEAIGLAEVVAFLDELGFSDE